MHVYNWWKIDWRPNKTNKRRNKWRKEERQQNTTRKTYKPHKNLGVNSGAPEWWVVPAPLVALVMEIRWENFKYAKYLTNSTQQTNYNHSNLTGKDIYMQVNAKENASENLFKVKSKSVYLFLIKFLYNRW